MLSTIKVNNKTLPWLVLERGFKIPSFNYAIESEEVGGRPGSIPKRRQLKELRFELPLIVRNDYLSSGGIKTHDEVLNELIKFFDYEEAVTLQISDHKWYWFARFEGPIELEDYKYGFWQFSINVVLTDPYKYAITGQKILSNKDQLLLENKGTADTPVIYEATALQDSSYFMITKGDAEYFMLGDDDADKKLKDYTPLLFRDDMKSLVGWTKQTTGIINDNYTGGTNGASYDLGDQNLYFRLKESTITDKDNNWSGAEYKRPFGREAQDFITTVKILVDQSKGGTTRFAHYVYDKNNRLLASLGFVNSSEKQLNGKVIVTLFDELGNQKKIYEYANKPEFYRWKTIIIYIQINRIGTEFIVKTWKYNQLGKTKNERTKPYDLNEKTWSDDGGFYQRPVVSVSEYTAKNKIGYHMPTYILGSHNRELLPKEAKSRDYIIKKGDVVRVDMVNRVATINDEPTLNLKTFGSDFFNIDTGMNECFIFPENTFSTIALWQDRYK